MKNLKDEAFTTKLGTVSMPSTEKADPLTSPNVPYVGLEHIEKDLGIINGFEIAAAVRSTKSVFHRGDLLYGKLRPYLNKIWVAEFDGMCSTDILVYPRNEKVNNNFLKYRFMSRDFVNYAAENSNGVNLPRVNAKVLAQFPLWLPSLDEQRVIVAEIERQFTRLDAGVAALKHMQTKLKRYRASVLKAACEGRLVPTEAELALAEGRDYESGEVLLGRVLAERREKWKGRGKYADPPALENHDLMELPEGWVWTTWGSVLSPEDGAFKRGPFGSALTKSIFVESGFKVYEQYCPINDDCSFGRYYITPEKFEELKTFAVKSGDYLISCSGVSLGRITRVPPVYAQGIINQALLRVRINERVITHGYFLRLFRSPIFQRFLLDNSTGSAIPNVKGVKELKIIPIPVPPLAEQHRIVAEVERLLSDVDELEIMVAANVQRASRLRQSILQQAFSGQLVLEQTPQLQLVDKAVHLNHVDRDFMRAVLSAEIVHQLHDQPTFGRVKHQKIFHLCEYIAELEEIEGCYQRKAAGPLDSALISKSEAQLNNLKWYDARKIEKAGSTYTPIQYVPLEAAGAHRPYFEKYWPDKASVIQKVIKSLSLMDSQQCEIISTIYAAWNDLILWGHEVTDDAIAYEILNRWHSDKKKVPEPRWRSQIAWIREKGFEPVGFGRATAEPE